MQEVPIFAVWVAGGCDFRDNTGDENQNKSGFCGWVMFLALGESGAAVGGLRLN